MTSFTLLLRPRLVMDMAVYLCCLNKLEGTVLTRLSIQSLKLETARENPASGALRIKFHVVSLVKILRIN